MSHAVSELDIQRCVDGELSAAAQQELLQRLDETDAGWRDLALAYVENQVIAGVCRSIAEPDAALSRGISPTVAELVRVQPFHGRLKSHDFSYGKNSHAQSVPQAPRRNANRFHWAITAASAVIGVGIGLFAGGGRPEATSGASQPIVAAVSGEVRSEEGDPSPADVTYAAAPQPVMNVEFADASGDASNWLLPVYAAGDLGPDYWQARDVLPADIERELARWGYRLDHEREFYSIPLDDGREIAVPVDTYQVRYTGL